MMKRRSKAMAVLLAVCMVFTMVPFNIGGIAKAESAIGSIQADGVTKSYTDYQSLKKDLEKMNNKEVTVEMLCDWDDSLADMTVGERLKIPEGSATTLNMNGHVFNRNMVENNKAKDDGEVILVMKGANLTVNGGSKKTSHEVFMYISTSSSSKPIKEDGLAGGLITGGASRDGAGGIHVYAGGNVTLNDVTIAGCRAASKGYGGGIYLEGKTHNVVLNNSKIMGCYASEDGGGIYAQPKEDITITLENSHIDRNCAGSDGGGINVDGAGAHIIGIGDSGIFSNQAKSRGGGLLLYGYAADVRGLKIKYNTAQNGAGIYCERPGMEFTDLIIEENKASSKGGGIYYRSLQFQDEVFSEVQQVMKDWQPGDGDVYYMAGDLICDCTVRLNTAERAGGVYMGGGAHSFDNIASKELLYVYSAVSLKGKVVIQENLATGNNAYKNFYVAADDWEDGRILTDLSNGSRVSIGYHDNDPIITLTPPDMKDQNSARYLYSDQEGWAFQYENGKTSRKRGRRFATPDPTKVEWSDANNPFTKEGDTNSKAGKVGTVSAGGSKGGVGDDSEEYDLIRFFSNHEAHDFISATYYSDGLFYGGTDPQYAYNEHLGTLSLTMAYAGGYLINGEKEDVNGNTYYNKHAAARQFLADIGCPDQNIYINDHMLNVPGPDTIGVTIGSKKLRKASGEETGDTLIPVTVRGLGYELEWASNLSVGTVEETLAGNLEAKGFASAADQVTAEIEYYLDKYGLKEDYQQGKVKFWVTGFSRAGATANLTCKRLVEKIHDDGSTSQVFGYTCEAPQGGTDLAEKLDPSSYFCIHNMINKADIVPYVAPGLMGVKRYGVDHYVPGSAAGKPRQNSKEVIRGGTGGITTVTTYADNEPLKTKGEKRDDADSKAFESQRDQMLQHLAGVDSLFIFDDYFHPMTLNFLEVHFLSYETMHQFEHGDYENNRIEDFAADVIRFAQEGKEPDKLNHWSQAITSRDGFAKNPIINDKKTYPTIQNALIDLVSVIMTMDQSESDRFMTKIMNIMDEFDSINLSGDSMLDIYDELVGEWYQRSDVKKALWATKILKKIQATGALDELSKSNKALFEKNFFTIMDLGLHLLDADYNNFAGDKDAIKAKGEHNWAHGGKKSMMYLATLLNYIGQIISYHFPQVNLAWARSYDNWYAEEQILSDGDGHKYYTGFTLMTPDSVDPPGAFVEVTQEDDKGEPETKLQELKDGKSEDNILPGDQRIILENKDIVGEAVYYDFEDITNDKTLAQNQIYRGGIDLQIGSEGQHEYQVRTYDMFYGVRSEQKTYNITIVDNKHNVIIVDKDADGNDRTQTLSFTDGQHALVQAGEAPMYFFKQWSVKLLDGQGNVVDEDITEDLLGSGTESMAGNAVVNFNMPRTSEDYPVGYQLEFTAHYGNRISDLEVEAIDPVAGQALADKFTVTFDTKDESKEYPVVWTYEDDGKTAAASGNAYNDTVYMATISLPQDQADEIMFQNSVEARIASNPVSEGIIMESPVSPNAADGSVTLQILFNKTAETGGDDKPSAIRVFKVNAIDLNTNQQDPDTDVVEYTNSPNQTMVITAPNVPGEQFVAWDLKDSGITLADIEGNELTNKTITIITPGNMPEDTAIDATYIPVVRNVDVNLYGKDDELFAPEGGGNRPVRAEMFVRISNEYEIHPDNLRITWSPDLNAKGEFNYLTHYMATVSIIPDENRMIKVRGKGTDGDYREVKMIVSPDKDMEVTFNGGKDNVSFGGPQYSVSKIFPASNYKLRAISRPNNIDNVEHGKKRSDIEGMLPGTTRILTQNGLELIAEITWTELTEEKEQNEERAESLWIAKGTVILPETVDNPDNISLDVMMTVRVQEAIMALQPSASLESDSYLANQVTTLNTNEEGGTTYYTTDGSDPTTKSNVYNGEQIFITKDAENLVDEMETDPKTGKEESTGRKMFVIKAVTVKDGLWNSDVATYEYVFENEVSVPEGQTLQYNGQPQIGVEGGLMYTLEPISKGVTINEDGNAVAAEPGTYYVKAKLSGEYYKWATTDEGESTVQDKTITFVIEKKNSDDKDTDKATDDKNNSQPASTTASPKDTKESKTKKQNLLMAKAKAGKTQVTISWNKVKGAKRYVIYLSKRGDKKVMTVNSKTRKWTKKKLKEKTSYTFKVVAQKKVKGKYKNIQTSPTGSVIIGNVKGKYTNPKSLTVKPSKVTLKVGKTTTIKGKVFGVRKGKKILKSHGALLRYISNDTSIATVSKKGKIKAKNTGTCKVYVRTANGIWKTVKVTVKKK